MSYKSITVAAPQSEIRAGPAQSWPLDTFFAGFEKTAGAYPDKTALTDGRRALSYAELAAAVADYAGYLTAIGLGKGARAALLSEATLDYLICVLACLKLGVVYVPLGFRDTDERLRHILSDFEPAVLLQSKAIKRQLPFDTVVQLEPEDPHLRKAVPAVALSGGDLAYVIYTSGSTGQPKGVPIRQSSLTNFAFAICALYETAPDDRVLQVSAPNFDVFLEEMSLAFFAGGSLHLLREEERFSPDLLTKRIQADGITISFIPIKTARRLDPARLETMRLVIFGGEALPPDVATAWAAGGRRVYNGYGPSEATIAVIQMLCAGAWDASPPIGRPMANHFVLLLDDTETPVTAPHQVGQIAIGGAGVFDGYLKRAKKTAEVLRTLTSDDPRYDGALVYLTGDLGLADADGNIHFRGRTDDQVKIDGQRIELGEIEHVIARHSAVETCIVQLSDNRDKPALVGYVRLAQGFTEVEDYSAFMRRKLPNHMIPRNVYAVGDFNTSSTGKIDRKNLPDPQDLRKLV